MYVPQPVSRRLASAACPLLLMLTMAPLAAEDWTRFRGSDGKGYLKEASIPDSWSQEDYLWQLPLPAADVGSPTIYGDKVFLLAADPASATRSVIACSLRDGRRLWQRDYPSEPHHLHKRNTYGASTPACDADHIYVAWSDPQHTIIKCLTHDGQEVWTRDLGSWISQHGFGTSPMLVDDKVVVLDSQQAEQVDPGQQPGKSRMVALDRTSGQTVWETPLTATRTCYGTPAVYQPTDGGPKQIVDCNTGDGTFGLDASTGKMLWNAKVFGARCVSSPIVAGDLILGSAGSGGGGNHLVAVRPSGNTAEQVYRIDRGAPYVPTPALVGDRLFMVADSGIASCVDVTDGQIIWSKRIGGNFGASPVVLGDKLLLIDLSGQATILRASDTFEKLGEVDLGGPVGATPAYSNGYLVLRVGEKLQCLGPRST